MTKIKILALNLVACREIGGFFVFRIHRRDEAGFCIRQSHAAFRTLWPGKRWHDRAEIEFKRIGEHRIRRCLGADQALCFRVFLDEINTRLFPARHGQIGQGFRIDGEEAAGRAIFGGHIRNRCAVGKRHRVEAGAIELNEFVDHTLFAQHLRDGQHKIGGGYAFFQLARQLEADDFRQQHGLRLAKHCGFRLDAAHAPTEHGQTIDHRGMRVGANECIGIGNFDRLCLATAILDFLFARPDGLRKIFQIYLMADARIGWHDREVFKRLLAPFQEAITLAIALIFEIDILFESLCGAEFVHNHRMVDDEINRNKRINLLRVAAQIFHGIAHGGQINHCRNARKILH